MSRHSIVVVVLSTSCLIADTYIIYRLADNKSADSITVAENGIRNLLLN